MPVGPCLPRPYRIVSTPSSARRQPRCPSIREACSGSGPQARERRRLAEDVAPEVVRVSSGYA
jgi:hypothetical protein